MAEQAVRMQHAMNPSGVDLLHSQDLLASLYIKADRCKEASELAEQDEVLFGKLQISDRCIQATFTGTTGQSLACRGEFEAAEAELLRAYDILSKCDRAPLPFRLRVCEYLVQLYQDWGKADKVSSWKTVLTELNRLIVWKERGPTPG